MDLQRAKISHVRVYESKEFVYVVGKCLLTAAGREFAASLEGRDEPPARDAERYRLLRFEKARSMLPEARKFKDFVYEDPGLYTAAELESVLKRLAEGKGRRSGALNRVVDAVAIVGVVRFVKGFYLVLISNRAEIGQLDEHVIYAAQGSHLVPLFDEAAVDASAGTPARKSAWSIFSGTQDPLSAMEDEFKSLFKLVDLSKSFYWSYTYNLSMSVQRNVAARIASRARERDPSMVPPGAAKAIAEDNMFIWNEYLARPLLDALQTSSRSVFLSPWTITLVHGSFKQQRCSILSRSLTLTLVARRSRFYAGTRYLKRGVNDDGYAANDVEIEQIVQDHMLLSTDPGGISAYVQMRGSIPTYWSQETSVAMPKPPIKRHRSDTWYTPTRMHFMDLISRYGDVILVLNLVKQTEKRKHDGNDASSVVATRDDMDERNEKSNDDDDDGDDDDDDDDAVLMEMYEELGDRIALQYERVVVPLRTLAEHPYELLAPNAKEEDQGAHGQEDGFPWISAANDQYADSWNRRAHEREFRDALKEQQIHENDGWGMRRLQAYSGSTSIIMSGDFKGYPRSVTATVLELA
ncbi:Phosphoinositide phosphatase SAC1 [Hondaea fermentalgiana]|uniref:Phosphoinositide phosphatase SAC1 n=1 Tax=Hondaea fermentalgiana TaxID=2315210 RepID=A0A2R5GK69_9STRA|nr:Phosphoinositide phosphatase SAC1 [Hondaea fermentalgiana]|eukprot:GBG31302.1 Phosphoinositide phosphatase SAC1 [Hondaea fermentalgiana]